MKKKGNAAFWKSLVSLFLMMLRIRFFAPKWSIHIRDHLRPFVELPGIAEDIVQVLERGGIVVAVADALIRYEGVVHVLLFLNHAGGIRFVDAPLGTEGEEYRTGAEIVEVVIDRRDTEGTHRRDEV